jgi:hypothetical protein
MTAVAVNSFDIDSTPKIVSAFTGAEPPVVEAAEPREPYGAVLVDERESEARDALLGHQLRDALSIPRDDRCGRVVRDDAVRRIDRSNRECGWDVRPP